MIVYVSFHIINNNIKHSVIFLEKDDELIRAEYDLTGLCIDTIPDTINNIKNNPNLKVFSIELLNYSEKSIVDKYDFSNNIMA